MAIVTPAVLENNPKFIRYVLKSHYKMCTCAVYTWVSSNLTHSSEFKNFISYIVTLLFTVYDVNVKLSLCLIKHYAMKTYWGNGGIHT